MSPEFAKEAAVCIRENGTRVYLFEALRPTPELSFSVRKLGCIVGIVITASHNPREYNGYKDCLHISSWNGRKLWMSCGYICKGQRCLRCCCDEMSDYLNDEVQNKLETI